MYPEEFVANLKVSIGDNKTSKVLESLGDAPPVSIRVNPDKISVESLIEYFAENADNRVDWCEDAFYLRQRPNFTMDPLFHAGAYYVQEASSMYVGRLMNIACSLLDNYNFQHMRILDLCAAPGGKTTHIISEMADESILVSNEVIRSRASILAENVAKWGAPNVVVSNNDPADFKQLTGYFDVVVADAPCSGEGLFRKDPDAIAEWSADGVALCAARQKRIVSDVWPALKEGGFLIYSTCTFNKYENMDNVEWFCSELGGELIEYRQFLPGQDRGEGFFCALIRKDGVFSGQKSSSKKVTASKILPKIPSGCSDFIKSGYTLFPKGELIKAYPTSLMVEMQSVEQRLRVIHSGVAVACQKGQDLIPEADLAISNIINNEAFDSVEITREEAVSFLAKQPLVFENSRLGYLLLKYRQMPLGFVKNLGKRSNNLYPMARRIRVL